MLFGNCEIWLKPNGFRRVNLLEGLLHGPDLAFNQAVEIMGGDRGSLEPDTALLEHPELQVLEVDLGLLDDLHEGGLLVQAQILGHSYLTRESC